MWKIKNLTTKVDIIFWIFIFPIGAGLRLFRLGHFSLWYDEGASIQLSKLVDLKLSFLSPLKNVEPPINLILTSLWLKFLESIRFWEKYTEWDDFAIRLLPCIWSILSIIIFFKIAKKLLSNSSFGILTSTFLFTIIPFHIYYAQELRIYSFYTLLNLIGTYCLLEILEENRWKFWIGLGSVFVLLMYTHYFSVWVIFVTNLFLLINIFLLHKGELFRKWFWTNLIAGILILPAIHLGWQFLEVMLSHVKNQWYPHPTLKTALITWKNMFAGYTDRTWAYWGVFVISTICFLLGTIKLTKEKSLYILIATALPILFNIIYWNIKDFSFYEHRLFIYSGVVGIFGVANGLAFLKPRFIRYGTSILLIGLIIICLHDYYVGRLHPLESHRLGVFEKVDFRSLSKYVRENHPKEACIIAYHSFSQPSLKHYLGNYQQFVIALSYRHTQTFINYLGNPSLLEFHGILPIPIKYAIKGQKELLFIHSTGISFEDSIFTNYLKKWFTENGKVLGEKEFKGVSVTICALEQKNTDN
ncbi:MAG: glycosyltransferase family 39 protein [Candidatus Hydrogenedentes bacterium]|nr:glycosyltransferase family 39 protein [Candidatus Hydrogenedentota bacterium]